MGQVSLARILYVQIDKWMDILMRFTKFWVCVCEYSGADYFSHYLVFSSLFEKCMRLLSLF